MRGMADLSTEIETQAAKSASTSNDGVSVSRRSLSELIEADKYLATKTAIADAGGPAAVLKRMVSKIVPPGGH